jgi:hypothetical protein
MGLFPVGPGERDLYLVSLRPVAVGEELTFDYSTSMVDEPWGLNGCACGGLNGADDELSGKLGGSTMCRGDICNFLDLPSHIQDFYAQCGALPLHTVQAYLTRGSGKAKGLTHLPLDHLRSPIAHLFPLAAYNSGAAEDEDEEKGAESDDSLAEMYTSGGAGGGKAATAMVRKGVPRSFSIETASSSEPDFLLVAPDSPSQTASASANATTTGAHHHGSATAAGVTPSSAFSFAGGAATTCE